MEFLESLRRTSAIGLMALSSGDLLEDAEVWISTTIVEVRQRSYACLGHHSISADKYFMVCHRQLRQPRLPFYQASSRETRDIRFEQPSDIADQRMERGVGLCQEPSGL
jgi:hypothetical protein